jgi:subtilisin family serine protease
MLQRFPLIVMTGMLLFLAACSDEPAGPAADDRSARPETAPFERSDGDIDFTDRYIVVFKDATSDTDGLIDELTRGNGSQVHFRYRHAIKGFCATIPSQALEGIRRNPNIAYIEADGPVSKWGVQANPPSWGLDRIDQRNLPLNSSYTYNTDGTGVTVYIIDTGIRFDHQEFSGRASSGYDFIDNDPDASDCDGHGTHVAGTVGGTTVGVAKNVTLKAVRVLNCSGSGSYSVVIAGVDWVKNNHASPAVANMSLGGGGSLALDQAVASAVASGVTFAVSAGNSNAPACNYSPAREPSAITVGSTTSTDARSSFSNYGSCVDIFAPGSSIYSSTMTSTNTYASWSGTSMSSPHVAGVAALYLSANPGANPTQVTAAIVNGATDGVVGNPGTGSPNKLLYSLLTGSGGGNPPAAPSALNAAAASSSQINLSWTDNAGDESGFLIERSLDGLLFSQIGSVGANVTNYSSTGLNPSTLYYFRVRAFNSYGNSAYSNTASATTLAASPVTYVHVGAANGFSTPVKNNWTATLDVTVHDASHAPVAGALVTVVWSGGASGSATAVTNSSGVASVTTSAINRKRSSVSMNVSNITGTGLSYNSGANHATLPVTVLKP